MNREHLVLSYYTALSLLLSLPVGVVLGQYVALWRAPCLQQSHSCNPNSLPHGHHSCIRPNNKPLYKAGLLVKT